MKKYIVAIVVGALFCTAAANAQGGGNFQRKTPEERVKAVYEKLDSAFKLDADKMKQVDDIFLTYYKDQDKKMEEFRAGGGQMDRDAMRAERQKLNEERDTKLKAVLTEAQMKIWKDELEPLLRPQRPNRGGGQQ
ncbi:MAG: hypothetical protein LH615_02435 [Ferruginibacter sp.]|nr:hypothetical protein [Ferruginibacter sp.]